MRLVLHVYILIQPRQNLEMSCERVEEMNGIYKQQISPTSGVRVIKISAMDYAPSGGAYCLEHQRRWKETSDRPDI